MQNDTENNNHSIIETRGISRVFITSPAMMGGSHDQAQWFMVFTRTVRHQHEIVSAMTRNTYLYPSRFIASSLHRFIASSLHRFIANRFGGSHAQRDAIAIDWTLTKAALQGGPQVSGKCPVPRAHDPQAAQPIGTQLPETREPDRCGPTVRQTPFAWHSNCRASCLWCGIAGEERLRHIRSHGILDAHAIPQNAPKVFSALHITSSTPGHTGRARPHPRNANTNSRPQSRNAARP